MLYLGLLIAAAHATPKIEIGIAPYGAFELSDPNRDTATWGAAFGTHIPARWWFHSKVALRGQASFSGRSGLDIVSWQDYANTFELYSDQHSTKLRTRGLSLGPEIKFLEKDIFELRAGVQVGGWQFQHFQTYQEDQPSPLRPLDSNIAGELLESSDSLRSAITLMHLSGSISLGSQFAIQAELGYCTSDVDSNSLTGPDPKRNAIRAGYGLNEIQFSLAFSYLFGAK